MAKSLQQPKTKLNPLPEPKHKHREVWLIEAMRLLDKEFFAGRGLKLPEKIQCSCGFPRGHAKAIGQCWDPEVSKDGTTHIFVCPTQADPIKVLDIMLHELCHAHLGVKVGHKAPFKKFVKELGLEGKPTATYAAQGTELYTKLERMAEKLGVYPHAPMSKKSKPKTPSTWVRLKSVNEEKYTVVISGKSLDEHGAPVDPWGDEMVLKNGEE